MFKTYRILVCNSKKWTLNPKLFILIQADTLLNGFHLLKYHIDICERKANE